MLGEHMVEVYTPNYFKALGLENSHCQIPQSLKMSDKEEESNATPESTHPQAVKAGGMRIVQDKSRLKKKSTSEDATVPQVDGVPHVQNSPPKAAAYLKDDNVEFSAKAVEAFHNKPEPKHNPHASTKPHVLHQPRK